MPCLNEAETIAPCVAEALAALAGAGLDGEVLVADNGSTDGSQGLAEAAGARVVPVAAPGYGAALAGGIAAARDRYVVMGDADLSYDFGAVPHFVKALDAGADLVMGSRFKGVIEKGAMPPLHRWLGNPVLTGLGRLFFRTDVSDFHCGLRGFRRDALLGLDLRTTGMEYATEMVVKAVLFGLQIAEIPVRLRPDGRSRPPHLRTWRDGWRHLKFLLAFSPRWLFLYPSLLLLGVGVLGMAVLSVGPLTVGPVVFDVQTMIVASAAVVLGVQGTGLALATRAFAARLGLLPASARLDRLLDRFALERGLVVGALLSLVGCLFFIAAVVHWQGTGFGRLALDEIRTPLIGLVLVVSGAQMILVSFMLSLTRIGENTDPV